MVCSVCRRLAIDGIPTNADEQRRVINHPVFKSGAFSTSFYEDHIAAG